MDVEIRPVTHDEFELYLRATERAFGHQPTLEEIENERKVFEPERSLAVFEGDRIVGTTGAFSLEVTVPGGTLPMAGVTEVGVAHTHRRRGLLTMMMRRQLDHVRELGEPLAGLWASEGAIYQRFGYGLATYASELEIERQWTGFARPYEWPGSVRLVEKDEAMRLMPPVLEKVADATPGMWKRSQAFWEHSFADLENWRDGASPLFFAIYESPDAPEGYVAYRVKHDWRSGLPKSTLRVRELLAATPEATAALWRSCFDHDLIGKIESWPRPLDEPLLHMLANPRALRLRVTDGLWLRLVDGPQALASRRYSTTGHVVFEVHDTFCPWNEGRYELEGGPDGASCRPSDHEPDLVVEAADLGAAFLGGARFGHLHRAGRVVEVTPGALGRADGMFGWDPLPFCSGLF
ncbi:MAG TPA: GNAT family N-acetyltransferase [Actinomycetota bacterium]